MPQIANGETGAAARAKINAVLPQQVAFATAIPLDGRKVMAAQSVAGALAFAPAAGAVLGGECWVQLTADGAHAPTFSGFTEHGSSAGFFSAAGVVNTLRFWCDGTTSWFAVAQALNVVPFVMQSAAIASDAPARIQVTFATAMNTATTPAAAAFAVASSAGGAAVADAVTAVAWSSATTLTLTKSRTTLAGDAVTLTYTPPAGSPLADTSGNAVAGSAIAVANNVAAAAGSSFVRMDNLTRFTEAAHGGGGYDYTPTSDSYGNAAFATSNARLAAGSDGWFAVKLSAPAGDGPMIGLAGSATMGNINGIAYGLYAGTGVGGAYSLWAGGGSPSPNGTATTCVAGDTLRAARIGTDVLMQVQRSGGTSWITVHTFGGTNAGQPLYPAIAGGSSAAGNIVVTPAGLNVA